MTHRRIWAVLAALAWLGAALYGGTASAHADIICRTDYGSGYTYTYCHGTDTNGYPYNTVTTCYSGSTYCTTKGM